jgi:hypothetical protein
MKKVLTVAVSLAVCSSSVVAATSTQSQGFSTALTASDSTVGGASGNDSRAIPMAFTQFDAHIGVLTGVSSTLNVSGGTLKLSSTGTWGSGSGNPALTASGTVLANSTLPGIEFGNINTLNFSCSGTSGGSRCFEDKSKPGWKNFTATDTTWLNPTSTTTNGLNSYVGASSMASSFTVTNTVALTRADIINSPTATLAVTGLTGKQSLDYTYLNHANASFTSGSDTNSLAKDISAGAFNFSVYNYGTADTANLASKSLTCTGGDCSAFKFTSSSFNALSAGNSFNNYGSIEVSDGARSGAYNATFALIFSDTHAGAASNTLMDNSLSLAVSANVAAVSAVPEPETYAMLLAGLSVIGLKIRRRRVV